jgi:hypothetical protein
MRQIPHDFAGLGGHQFLILSVIQSIVDGAPYVLRIRKRDFAPVVSLAHDKARRRGQTVLPRPRIDRPEQVLVRLQHIVIGKLLLGCELGKRRIKAGGEGRVLHLPDDLRFFSSGNVAQIAARFKITKRIECHGLVSRRYRACRRTISD